MTSGLQLLTHQEIYLIYALTTYKNRMNETKELKAVNKWDLKKIFSVYLSWFDDSDGFEHI